MTATLTYRPTGSLGQAAAARQVPRLLRRLLRREGALARLVRIDGLRELFDKRWTDVEPGVRGKVADALTRLVGEDGVWLPYDDLTYLLLPPDDRGFDDGALAAALKTLQTELAGSTVAEPLISAWVPRSEAENGWVFAPAAAPTPPPPPPPPTPAPAPVKESPAGGYKVVSPTEPALVIDGGQAEDGAAAEPGKTRIDGQVVFADIDLFYLPVWEIRRNAVFAYLCEPVWRTPDGRYRHEDAVEMAFKSDRARLAVDLTVLHKAYEAFEDLLEHERLSSIILPVHYATLADSLFENRYVAECNRIIGQFHQFICFEIVGLPERVEAEEFAAVTASIRPYCRALLVRAALSCDKIAAITTPDVFAVSVDLRDDDRPETEIIADLKTLQDRLRAAGGVGGYACAHGLTSKSLTVAAICEGFDLIGSDAIAAALEGWPMDDYLVRPIDIYAKLLKG